MERLLGLKGLLALTIGMLILLATVALNPRPDVQYVDNEPITNWVTGVIGVGSMTAVELKIDGFEYSNFRLYNTSQYKIYIGSSNAVITLASATSSGYYSRVGLQVDPSTAGYTSKVWMNTSKPIYAISEANIDKTSVTLCLTNYK
jgi:hypothetical protein